MSKPTVTLTFAGDESKLTSSMDKVGTASETMGSRVGRSSEEMATAGSRAEAMAEKTDTAEARSQGFADVLTGATEGLAAWNDESLSGTEKMIALGQAGADLAGGLTNFLIPAISSVATFLKGGLSSAMSFVAAHPLVFVLLALVAVFVLLWTQSETFRRVVMDAFNAVGRFIRDTFGPVIGWIVDRWNDMIGWFKDLPRKIGEALSGIGRFVGDAFKSGLNVAIDIVNWFVRRANDLIDGINWVSPFADIPHIPQIARMHSGGVVSGTPGSEQLRILQAGEQVIPRSGRLDGGGGGTAVTFGGNTDSAFAGAFMKLVRDGTIQLGGT